MPHVRKQIRDAIKDRLTGLDTTESNVFASRVHPFHNDGAELPGLCFFATTEEVRNDEEDTISHSQIRDCLVVVNGYASAVDPEDMEDTLDQIASEVEEAIYTDQFLTTSGRRLSMGIDLVGTDHDLDGEAGQPVGVVMMIFRVQYMTAEGVPDTAQ